MRVWGLKNCDTTRKALRELAGAGYAPELVDMRRDGLQEADIERFYTGFGAPLVNRRSTTWRGLSAAERAGAPVAAILANPALMKRPVIEHEGRLTLGWDAKTREEWLGKPGPGA